MEEKQLRYAADVAALRVSGAGTAAGALAACRISACALLPPEPQVRPVPRTIPAIT